MIREERAKRRESIRQLYSEGALASELAERFDITEGYIYIIAKGVRPPSDTMIDILKANVEEVINLLENDVTYREVAEMFRVSEGAVRRFCKEYGVQHLNANSEEVAARRIREKTNGLLEYVSGYTVKEKPVRVRCSVCGGEFERTYHNLTTKGRVSCPYCKELERNKRKMAEDAERKYRKAERERKARERKAEAERREKERKHECPVCGVVTTRQKYCCRECQQRAHNKTKDHRRRMLLTNAMIDNDITIEGLFRRDRGVCYICGGRCDFEDYTVRGESFIAGDWYPSIEHVVPLSKGGEHSWDNVKLAHRRCNTKKGNKIVEI